MSKVRFSYYVHDQSMTSEVAENIADKLPEGVDVALVAEEVSGFCYEVELKFEWDTETNTLVLVGAG